MQRDGESLSVFQILYMNLENVAMYNYVSNTLHHVKVQRIAIHIGLICTIARCVFAKL